MRPTNLAAAVLCLVLAGAAQAQRRNLEVGDPVPGLSVDAWVHGDELTIVDAPYLVVFWEKTSVGGASEANLKSLARLKEFHQQYGHQGLNILVIGADSADQLQDFARKQTLEGITLAADSRSATRRAWADRSGKRGFPLTFIVGSGKIMYAGSPDDEGFADILGQVVGGRYDPVLQQQAEPMLRAARRAREVKNWRMAVKHYDDAIALDAKVFAFVALERFEMMMIEMDEPEQANAYARQELVAKVFNADAGALQMLALEIATDPKIPAEHRDLDIALAAVQQALELTGSGNPKALAAAARVHYVRGEVATAIDLQTKAYFLARPETKSNYKRVLRSYQDAASQSTAGHRRR